MGSGRCLKGILKVTARCLVSERCLERVLKVSGKHLEGIWKDSGSHHRTGQIWTGQIGSGQVGQGQVVTQNLPNFLA